MIQLGFTHAGPSLDQSGSEIGKCAWLLALSGGLLVFVCASVCAKACLSAKFLTHCDMRQDCKRCPDNVQDKPEFPCVLLKRLLLLHERRTDS